MSLHTRSTLLLTLLSVLGVSLLSSPASAEPITGDIGGGLSYKTHDPSGSRYETRPVPYFDVTWDNVELSSDDGLQWSALKGGGFSAGPFVNYVDGRTAHRSLRGLGDVDGMLEAGGFVEYSPQPWWNVFAQAGRTTGGGSGNGGVLGKLGGELDYPVYGAVMGSTNLTANYSDRAMMQTFFGVDGSQSQASGLPGYHAAGGLQNTVLSQGLLIPLVGQWSLLTNLSWTRLHNSAAESPIVKQRGRVDQAELDTAVSYHF
jgi:outer membrane scaffolding protein for murein synthesis (MipA/OmpV family)